MSRINTIELDGHKIELYFSTWAMIKISDLVGGDIDKLGEWLVENNNTGIILERISSVMTVLANAAVLKRNADIALGLEQGEKKELYPPEYFLYTANAADIMRYRQEIFDALNMGTAYDVPEGVTVQEKDIDLAEIEKEKNLKGRAVT